MTVRRHSDDYFDAAPTAVASAVRTVLARHPPYVRADEVEKDVVFKTNVRPGWWLLGTGSRHPVAHRLWLIRSRSSLSWATFSVITTVRHFLQDLRSELQRQSA